MRKLPSTPAHVAPAFFIGAFFCLAPPEGVLAMPVKPRKAAPSTLGKGLAVVAFSPGRYGSVIQSKMHATHAQQVVREDSNLSFLLELAPDGAATAWRGWSYQLWNDGPEVHTAERFRERQGYRGNYEVKGDIIRIDLHADDGVTPPIREFSPIAPRRSASISLRCQAVAPREHGPLPGPALVCDWQVPEPPTREREGYMIAGVLPVQRLILGAGNGLRFRVIRRSVDPAKSPEVQVEAAPAPIGPDDWERSF